MNCILDSHFVLMLNVVNIIAFHGDIFLKAFGFQETHTNKMSSTLN